VTVLAQAAPRRLGARDRGPHHRRTRGVARISVPVADDAERALGRNVLAQHVVADVAVVDAPPWPLVVAERQAAGAVVLAANRPPALERVGRLPARAAIPVPQR